MGYVIAAILVVLIVGGGVALFVRSATTRKGQAQIASPDEGTPVGDTSEHAGEQTRAGETAEDPEGTSRGSQAREPSSPGVGGPGEGGVGGEGEGSRPATESERLANRPR